MNLFQLNNQFNDYKSLMNAKKAYEESTNTLLSTGDSLKLPDPNSELTKRFVYQRMVLRCKAGPERQCQSKGYRKSSTIKKDCPVKVRINLQDEKFVVTKSVLTHENHATDKVTYNHYSENLRIPEDKLPDVKRMISLRVNKQLLKADLEADGTTIVPLKTLHNIQTAMNKEKETNYSGHNDLQKVLEKLKAIPNARVRVVTNEQNELIGIYFQDDRMAQIFEKFPELLLYDTTYKMNNRDLPLTLQLCVDGNGETEIASLFIAQSESLLCIGAMIDIFQEFNQSWTKTQVILGDKDFADRNVYREKFPNAVLQICLYHVLVNFGREITTTKRNITKTEREFALEIIQRLVYSTCEEAYDSAYQELIDLNLEEVTEYYNDNWHPIRDEWTLYGRNKYANYLNWTNNRTESINQKFKMLGNRYANLFTFFNNLFSTVSVLASERNIRAVKSTMRVQRKRFDDECLARYNQLLTPFVFEKIQEQYELSEKIHFASLTEENGITKKTREAGHSVNNRSCSCMFFSAMVIPCRHIFQFLKLNDQDLYLPNLIAPRWTKEYFYKSHPALNGIQHVAAPRPISFSTMRVPEEIDKYKRTAKITKDINNFVASMSNSQFMVYFEKIEAMRNEIISVNGNIEDLPRSSATSVETEPSSQIVHDSSLIYQGNVPRSSQSDESILIGPYGTSIETEPSSQIVHDSSSIYQRNVPRSSQSDESILIGPYGTSIETESSSKIVQESSSMYQEHVRRSLTLREPISIGPFGTSFGIKSSSQILPESSSMQQTNVLQSSTVVSNGTLMGAESLRNNSSQPLSYPRQNVQHTSTSGARASTSQPTYPTSNDVRHITLPPKNAPSGRPKGTGKTAIRLPKKNVLLAAQKKNVLLAAQKKNVLLAAQKKIEKKKIKFFERKLAERGPIIVQWLTNWSLDKIAKKKVNYSDIIQDPIIFNRLRDKNLDISVTKKLFDIKTYKYIVDEINRIKHTQHTCTKCRKLLNGLQIMCHGCLDWYHAKCLGKSGTGATNDDFFCSSCSE